MIHLVRSEWIKFRSVRSNVFTLVAAGGLVVLVAVLAARDQQKTGPFGVQISHLGDLTGGVSAAALLFGALGVQAIGQEHRFSTIRPTFTAAPWRLRVMAAKAFVVTSAAVLVSALMVAFCWLVGTLMLDRFEVDGMDQRVAFGIILFSAGWTILGVAVGAIVRQPVAGILVLLGDAFVVENILANVVKSSARWLPFLNGFQMTLRSEDSEGPVQLQSVLGGGIYFFAVTVVVLAVGLLLTQRRDA